MSGKLIINQPDFKAYEIGQTLHNGKPYILRQCFELVGGKWEGFVSMTLCK